MQKEAFIDAHRQRLRDFAELSQTAGSRVDYVQGGGGNTSVKLNGSLMAIKASGFRLSDIQEDAAYAVLNFAEIREFFMTHQPEEFTDVEQAGAERVKASILQVEGLPVLRPSVEAGFHSLLGAAVLHTHSVYANLAACAKEGRKILEQAFAGADYAWGIVPYVNPGARLTFAMRDTLEAVKAEAGKKPAVLLMQNHGIIVHHDDMRRCAEIHTDANERIARAFHISANSFPKVELWEANGGMFVSGTPFLKEQMLSGDYSGEFLQQQPLYPDQLVFLDGTFSVEGEPEQGKCALNPANGLVTYHMDKKLALVVEETLTAVTFIASTIRKAGYSLCVMGEAEKEFIAGWESERYRKTLARQSGEKR